MTLTDILLAAEFFLLILFLNPLPDLNAGNALGIAGTAAAMLLTVYPDRYPTLTAVFVCLTATAAVAGFVLTRIMYRAADNSPPTDKPVTLIVLGCRVKGDRPTRMLRRRLNAAAEYLNAAPQAVCIVSGGKGTDEKIAEAQAMYTYLTARGIAPERILVEDRSRTTAENLAFSKAMMTEHSLPETTALATDSFHQYRAAMLAKRVGIRPYAVSAHTEPRYLLTYLVREWIAIIAYATIKSK